MNIEVSGSIFSNLKLTRAAIFLFALTTLVAFGSAFPGTNVPLMQSIVLAAVLSSVIASFALLISMLSRAIRKPSRRGSILLFATQVLIIGVFRGYIFYAAVDFLDLQQPTPLQVRLITSVINTAIWLTFSCALIEATAYYSKQFNNLFRKLSIAVASNPGFSISRENVSLNNLVALKQNLSEILSQASDRGVSSDTLLEAGLAVREQIEKLLKPLSHRLWFNEQRNHLQIRMFGLIRDAITDFSFVTPRFLLVFGGLEFAAILNAYSMERVLLGVLLSLAFLLLGISIFKILPLATVSRLGPRISIPFIFSMALIPVPLADRLMPIFGQQQMLFPISAATIVAPIAIIVLLIVESCIALVERDRRMLNLHFLSQFEDAESVNPSSLASYLHNSLQSELTGIAYKLEAAAANPNSPESRETLEKLGALINRSISEDFANFDEAPLLRLDRMVDAWDGIATVTFEIEEGCKSDPAHLNLLVQVIEESTTNSVRYGKAKRLHAKITKLKRGSMVEITTDGLGAETFSGGLGSSWLKNKTIRQSPLEFSETGTRWVMEIRD